jgi:two-component system sensor histidine kinase/response regulator
MIRSKRYSGDVALTMNQEPETAPLLDRSAALERIGGDEELLREIARLFLSEYPLLIQEIRLAIENGDTEALERSAHSLKGSVANFEARCAVDAAFRLEALGRNRSLDRVGPALADLEAAFESLNPELKRLSSE